jgi:hypothetical protein
LASVRARRNRSPTAVGRRGELKTFCGPAEGQVFGPSTSSLQNGALLVTGRHVAPPRVSAECPLTQTHYPTGATKKTCKMQAFPRAAEGIRTLDLLHGKQTLIVPPTPEIPANHEFCGARATGDVSTNCAEMPGVWTPNGHRAETPRRMWAGRLVRRDSRLIRARLVERPIAEPAESEHGERGGRGLPSVRVGRGSASRSVPRDGPVAASVRAARVARRATRPARASASRGTATSGSPTSRRCCRTPS